MKSIALENKFMLWVYSIRESPAGVLLRVPVTGSTARVPWKRGFGSWIFQKISNKFSKIYPISHIQLLSETVWNTKLISFFHTKNRWRWNKKMEKWKKIEKKREGILVSYFNMGKSNLVFHTFSDNSWISFIHHDSCCCMHLSTHLGKYYEITTLSLIEEWSWSMKRDG